MNSFSKTPKRDKLTPREVEIMTWTARGKTYGEISTFLSIAQDTIKAHIESVRRKLDATNKTHAVALAIVLGHLKFEDILPKIESAQTPKR